MIQKILIVVLMSKCIFFLLIHLFYIIIEFNTENAGVRNKNFTHIQFTIWCKEMVNDKRAI